MKRTLVRYRDDERGAVAALYAMALFGLVAIAGVGWDYGRLMAMDSELQNAADQAALAAATQLDGRADAMDRARQAVNNYLANADNDFVNVTRLANDGLGRPITAGAGGDLITIEFYDGYDSADDEFGAVADADDEARVVHVTVNGREAFFALTPIVGLISSGVIAADAVAGTEAATCNVAPLMFCIPDEDPNFGGVEDIGKSIELRLTDGNTTGAGQFDLLQIDYERLLEDRNLGNSSLGLNADQLGCVASVATPDVQTRTGRRPGEDIAINTRFDLRPPGNQQAIACADNGDFCPAQVIRNSQLMRVVDVPRNQQNMTCSSAPTYTLLNLKNGNGNAPPFTVPEQSYPSDDCFALGGCPQPRYGDGVWSTGMANYFSNVLQTAMPADIDTDNNGRTTRYEVYQWEIGNSSAQSSQLIGREYDRQGRVTKLYCSHPTPTTNDPVIPDSQQRDRRVMTVAATSCAGLNGSATIRSPRWVDIFLLGPVEIGGNDSKLRAEILGPARVAGGGSGFQNYGRTKPVLLR